MTSIELLEARQRVFSTKLVDQARLLAAFGSELTLIQELLADLAARAGLAPDDDVLDSNHDQP